MLQFKAKIKMAHNRCFAATKLGLGDRVELRLGLEIAALRDSESQRHFGPGCICDERFVYLQQV